MGHERCSRAEIEDRAQLVPRVVLGGDLGQRADREPTGQPVGLVEHRSDVLGRRQQRKAVFGERCGGPQLTAGRDGVARTVTHAQQTRPVAGAATVVDHAHQPVEVGAVDQFVEGIVGHVAHGQTSGQG